jgi:hypothetical protein
VITVLLKSFKSSSKRALVAIGLHTNDEPDRKIKRRPISLWISGRKGLSRFPCEACTINTL